MDGYVVVTKWFVLVVALAMLTPGFFVMLVVETFRSQRYWREISYWRKVAEIQGWRYKPPGQE